MTCGIRQPVVRARRYGAEALIKPSAKRAMWRPDLEGVEGLWHTRSL